MAFPLNVYLAAFLSALVTTLVTTPLWRKWSLRTGLVDDPGHRKIHHSPTPLSGGLAVLTGLLVPLVVAAIMLAVCRAFFGGSEAILYGLERRAPQLAALVFGALAIVALGWFDDKHELRPLHKFGGQLLVAALVAASGIRITLFVPNTVFSYAVTILWLLTVINAFNFTDNMNGLCTGLGTIGAAFFAVASAMNGHYLVASLALLMCGALLGFLPYNFPNARAFLGDAGSHLVGYLLAVLAILPHFHSWQNPRPWAVITPLFILAIPLADLTWVVLLRWRAGKPFYVGDTNHLSHRLVRAGLSQTKAVLLIWLAATLLGVIPLL
jgi:UDP-GlcNAc:undecaprenyl-phosphate GlcNAc-1-phosphate transferase